MHHHRVKATLGFLLLGVTATVSTQSPAVTPRDLIKDNAVAAALAMVKNTEAEAIADQIRFCEIPAPSFKEEVRGREL